MSCRMGRGDSSIHRGSRVNGCSPCPPHPYQGVAWGFLGFFGLIYFTTIVPGLRTNGQIPAYVIVILIFIAHAVVHVAAILLDPADVNVRRKRQGVYPGTGPFDRNKHKHVIENLHCYLCEVDVHPKSKHCSACNKCVGDFDHHCKWLNNCIGSRNYRVFIATLVTSVLGCLIIGALAIYQFVVFFTDKENGDHLQWYRDNLDRKKNIDSLPKNSSLTNDTAYNTTESNEYIFKLFYIPAPGAAWAVFIGITAVLTLIAVGLLGELLIFHFTLIKRGLSTYDVIVQERQKAERAAQERETDLETGCKLTSRSKGRNNQIGPGDGLEQEYSDDGVSSNGGAIRQAEQALQEADSEPNSPSTSPKKEKKEISTPDRDKIFSRDDNKGDVNTSSQSILNLSCNDSAASELDAGFMLEHINNKPYVEKLNLPESSDEDQGYRTRGPNTGRSEASIISVYSPRRYNAIVLKEAGHGNSYNPYTQCTTDKNYYSGSAESVKEIPVSDTCLGSKYGISPGSSPTAQRNSRNNRNGEVGNTFPRRKKKKKKKFLNAIVNGINARSCEEEGDTDGAQKTVLPSKLPPIRNMKASETTPPTFRKVVPPLDLSELHKESDTEVEYKSSKHKNHIKQQSSVL